MQQVAEVVKRLSLIIQACLSATFTGKPQFLHGMYLGMNSRLKKLNDDLVIAIRNNNSQQTNHIMDSIKHEEEKESLMKWVWYR